MTSATLLLVFARKTKKVFITGVLTFMSGLVSVFVRSRPFLLLVCYPIYNGQLRTPLQFPTAIIFLLIYVKEKRSSSWNGSFRRFRLCFHLFLSTALLICMSLPYCHDLPAREQQLQRIMAKTRKERTKKLHNILSRVGALLLKPYKTFVEITIITNW